jgi:ribosomal protein S6--L-glutamate ligase
VLLLPRAVGEHGSGDFQIEVYRAASEAGCVLVNDVAALLSAVDKFRSSVLFERAGVPTPETVVVQQATDAREALEAWGAAVCKPLYGSLGTGVRLLYAGQTPKRELVRLCLRYRALYLQRYVEAPHGDVRAFVVGDRVIAAVRRLPPAGDFRANARRGARAELARLDDITRELAVRAARAVGLDYTGVDLIETDAGPKVLEVNGTPGWQAMEHATGCDIADGIVVHALELARRGAQGTQNRSPGRRSQPEPEIESGNEELSTWMKKKRKAI